MKINSNIALDSSIKILAENPKVKALTALGDAIFHAQTKSFQRRHDYLSFDLPLIFNPNLEFQLNQYFNFQKTEKQFDFSLKQHKYILQKYKDLEISSLSKQDFIEDFKSKISADKIQNNLKKYFHSGGSQRRQNIIEQAGFEGQTTQIFDQYFFNNPFLSSQEISHGLSILNTIERKTNSRADILTVFKHNILSKNAKYIDNLVLETGLEAKDIYELNSYFNPRIFLLKDPSKWENVQNTESDFDLLYKAMAVTIIFYKVKIDEVTHKSILNKLNQALSKLENQIKTETDSSHLLIAKMDNIQTLTNLFANLYQILPTLDLKTRALVREISTEVEQNKGLLTWEYVLNTSFYGSILQK